MKYRIRAYCGVSGAAQPAPSFLEGPPRATISSALQGFLASMAARYPKHAVATHALVVSGPAAKSVEHFELSRLLFDEISRTETVQIRSLTELQSSGARVETWIEHY